MKKIITFAVIISLTSCKKESSQLPDLKVTKVELIQNGEVAATSKPVYK